MRNILYNDHAFERLMTKDDLIRFSMFYAIGTAKNYFFVTNDTNVIIGQERPTSPLWIYIKNNLFDTDRKKVAEIICEKLTHNPNLNVDGEEKHLNSILKEVSNISGIPFKISLPKNSYTCPIPIKPQMICGNLSKAIENDLETVAIFSKDNWEDIGFGILTPEQAKRFAKQRLANSDFHVWRNEFNRVVAMATVHKYNNVALTDGVFVDRNERNKGYAKFLMYTITKNLLDDGFIPMLYADRRKAAPNHVYKSIGYEYYGKITEYRFLTS